MSDELKPCPFCGGKAVFIGHTYEWSKRVGCENCGSVSGVKRGDDSTVDKELAQAWNQRAESARYRACVEALRIAEQHMGPYTTGPTFAETYDAIRSALTGLEEA